MKPPLNHRSELADLVDENDNVIGEVDTALAHANGLLHRVVYVWIFNSSGEILLQQRASTNALYPNCWDSSVGEHVGKGESYEHAALRGMREELSLPETKLEWIGKARYEDNAPAFWVNDMAGIFVCQTDAKFKIQESELHSAQFWTTEELDRAIEERPEHFAYSFRSIWKQYSRNAFEKLRHVQKPLALKPQTRKAFV